MLVIFAMLFFVPAAFAGGSVDWDELVTVSRKVTTTGEFQQYVPFPFWVTSGECGQLETYHFQQSFQFLGIQGEMTKMDVGTLAPAGFYKFKNPKNECSAKFQLNGQVPRWVAEVDSWSTLEIEPEDLGLLSKNGSMENVFEISTDDRKISVELVMPSIGSAASLDQVAEGSMFYVGSSKKLVGAVISNDHGFLHKKAMWNDPWLEYDWGVFPFLNPIPNDAKDIVVKDGDIVVLIWQELGW